MHIHLPSQAPGPDANVPFAVRQSQVPDVTQNLCYAAVRTQCCHKASLPSTRVQHMRDTSYATLAHHKRPMTPSTSSTVYRW
jgi:hypothetical protein